MEKLDAEEEALKLRRRRIVAWKAREAAELWTLKSMGDDSDDLDVTAPGPTPGSKRQSVDDALDAAPLPPTKRRPSLAPPVVLAEVVAHTSGFAHSRCPATAQHFNISRLPRLVPWR